MKTKLLLIATLFLTLAAAAGHAADNGHVKLVNFVLSDGSPADGSDVKGSSGKLTRGDGVVWLRINTTGLPAGAYTNWWVIFNNPDACGESCDGSDFPNPDVGASVLWATGGVVTDTGVGHFRAHLEENNAPGEVLFGPGLMDAAGAEIHIIVRYHGPAGAGDVLIAQTTTFGGGCSNAPNPYPIFPCYDPQAAVFPRP